MDTIKQGGHASGMYVVSFTYTAILLGLSVCSVVLVCI